MRKAIPEGYMTVGELAKKMNITVRTLQYYDREDVLIPSAVSEGGRRLYTDKDAVILHQILSLKYLGFSLEDIKTRLVKLDTPKQVADALSGQAEAIQERIDSLREVKKTIEKLREETLQMQTVNFRKYADIVMSIQEGNNNYWVIKGIGDNLWEHIRKSFDKDRADDYIDRQNKLFIKAAKLKKSGVLPDSKQGLEVGKMWCDMLIEFTGGDMSMLPEMENFSRRKELWDEEWRSAWEDAEDFLTPAMEAYIKTLGHNPFDS